MKYLSAMVLVILIILAVSSGVAKIVLIQQDVDFFGKYGFSNLALITFGLVQLIGGVLLVLRRTRFAGATILAITFVISLVLLLMDGNMPLSIATIVAILLLGVTMKQSWGAADPES